MMSMKLTVLLFFGVALSFNCGTEKKVAKSSTQHEAYTRYLSSVVNDTTFYELPELIVMDNGIFHVLDSIILWSEKCNYFDTKVRYLNSFLFEALPKENGILYSINSHISPSFAIGLNLVRAGFTKQIANVGVFYYKHYLFVVPTADYKEQKDLEYFPFFTRSGKNLKIKALEFFNEKVYASFITFNKSNDSFKIIKNEVCGLQILVQ